LLAVDGVSAKELVKLREGALADQIVDDNERIFLAALLDPANAKLVTAMGVGRGAKVTFSRASIQTNVVQVRELGREKADRRPTRRSRSRSWRRRRGRRRPPISWRSPRSACWLPSRARACSTGPDRPFP
jgi:hypothetical protein